MDEVGVVGRIRYSAAAYILKYLILNLVLFSLYIYSEEDDVSVFVQCIGTYTTKANKPPPGLTLGTAQTTNRALYKCETRN